MLTDYRTGYTTKAKTPPKDNTSPRSTNYEHQPDQSSRDSTTSDKRKKKPDGKNSKLSKPNDVLQKRLRRLLMLRSERLRKKPRRTKTRL